MAESRLTEGTEPIQRLAASIAAFSTCAQALPDDLFLYHFTTWAPRDVVAHLIGWNRYTREAVEQIRRGEMPPYLVDLPNDFANVNMHSVQTYSSTDAATLLNLLKHTGDELLDVLSQLAQEDWMRDFGARNPVGQPVFIRRQVDRLTDDYEAHTREIAQWQTQRIR